MPVKVQQWGESLAIRIPKESADAGGLEPGMPVEVGCEDGKLRITKRGSKRYDLGALLASVPEDFDDGEWDLGARVGSEIG